MPSTTSLMLRSAWRARLEARTTPMQRLLVLRGQFLHRFPGACRRRSDSFSFPTMRHETGLVEILDVRVPRMLFHRREARAPVPGMDLELVAVGVEKIERGTFTAVVLPDRRPRGADPRGGVIELRAGDAEGDVGVFRQRRRPGPLINGKAQPQIAGKEVGAFAPARQRLCPQRLDVEAERPVE